jgi:hypothetical protein
MNLKSVPWFKAAIVVLLVFALWFSWDAKNAAGGAAGGASVYAFVDPASPAGKPAFGTPIQANAFVYNNGGIPVFLSPSANASVECGGKTVGQVVEARRGEKSLVLKDAVAAIASETVLVPGDYTSYSFSLPAVDASAGGAGKECEIVFSVFEARADGEGFQKDFVLGVFPKK